MQRACYRCAVQVEDQVPFCPACGAPQIRVSSPQDSPSAAPDQPLMPQFDPGTPGSIEPPAVPVALEAGRAIQWKHFLRIVLPLAFVNGLATLFQPGLGFLFLLISVFFGVSLYRRNQKGSLDTSKGIRLGAVLALLSFGFFLAFFVFNVSRDFSAYRQQSVHDMQEYFSHHPNPAVQEKLTELITNNRGFLLFLAIGHFMILVFFVVSGMLVGMAAGALSGRRDRS